MTKQNIFVETDLFNCIRQIVTIEFSGKGVAYE